MIRLLAPAALATLAACASPSAAIGPTQARLESPRTRAKAGPAPSTLTRVSASASDEAARLTRAQELKLPRSENPAVASWRRYFTGRGRRTFETWLARAQTARPIVTRILREHGLPTDLHALAMVESGYSSRALSHARASGPWQFMAPTARRYGLKINFWLDERRNLEKATHAAAEYLSDLHREFGDWYLAMAAYNAGPGRVRRAIRKTKSRDYWEICRRNSLSKETRGYVPKALAALALTEDPSAYGFGKTTQSTEPASALFHTRRPIDIGELARKLGVSSRQMRHWNPELKQGVTPPTSAVPGGVYALRLPERLLDTAHASLPKLAKLEVSDVKMHRVRSGETFSHIAKRYRVSLSQIMKLNRGLSPRKLRVGRLIAVPVPSFSRAKRRA